MILPLYPRAEGEIALKLLSGIFIIRENIGITDNPQRQERADYEAEKNDGSKIRENKESDYEQMLVNIIQYIETDKPLFQMLFSMQSFRSRFTALLKEFDETIWKIYSGREISSDLWDYLITYHIQGILACLDQWLSGNPPFSHYDLIRMLTLLDNAFDDLVEEHCCNKQT